MAFPKGGHRLLRYGATGGAAAVVDLGGFALLMALQVPLLLSGTLSFAMAVLVNFFLSSYFVFRMPVTFRRLLAFALGASVGLVVNMGITVAMSAWGMAPTLAKAIGIWTAFLVNYTVNVVFVYRT
jgi:putative flippase GtrA